MAPLVTTAREDEAEALILRHRALARHLAQRYVRGPEQREDLEQVACLGLVKAARRYDPERGTAFTTFAVPTVLGELRRYCRDTRWAAHVPRSIQEDVQALRALEDRYQTRRGRAPTPAEAAAELGRTEEEVIEARVAASTLSAQSLNTAIHSADGTVGEAIDLLGDEDGGFEAAERRDLLERALEHLSPVPRRALALRIEDELSTPEIAHRMGLSASQVSRLIGGALQELRAVIEEGGGISERASRTRRYADEPSHHVNLACADPDLFTGLDDAELARARRTAIAPRVRLDNDDALDEAGAELLILSGALLRVATLGGRSRAELLGPGDVVRPQASDAHTLPAERRWQVLGSVTLAVLEPAVMRTLCRWPSVVDALLARAAERSHELARQLAFTDLRRVDDRLIALFWSLADRYGTRAGEEVRIPLALTHDVIALLAGAHRPTVTAALRRLAHSGQLRRLPDRTWSLIA